MGALSDTRATVQVCKVLYVSDVSMEGTMKEWKNNNAVVMAMNIICLAQFKKSKLSPLQDSTILLLSLVHPSLSSCFGTMIAPSVASALVAIWSNVTLAVVKLRRNVYYAMVSVAALPVATSTV